MCPTARSRRDIHNERVTSEHGCQIGLPASKLRMSLRNEHFQNAARGPLKYVGPGPSAPHFENVHFEKTKEGGDPVETIDFTPISSFKGSPGLGTITSRSALTS